MMLDHQSDLSQISITCYRNQTTKPAVKSGWAACQNLCLRSFSTKVVTVPDSCPSVTRVLSTCADGLMTPDFARMQNKGRFVTATCIAFRWHRVCDSRDGLVARGLKIYP